MASRKEQKEAARAQREQIAAQQSAADARRRRLRTLGAIVVAAAAAIAIVIAVSSGGGSDKPSGLAAGGKATALGRQVAAQFAGIPQRGTQLGRASAPVSMTYFSDLECPVCRAFTLDSLGQVVDQEVKSGKLRLEYRSLQTATQDPATFQTQQVAALAAAKQNRLWQYVELFYRQQGQEGTAYVDDAFLTGLARQIPGLDLAKWQSARQDAALAGAVRADATAASVAGANATPTLVVRGPNGTKVLSGLVAPAAIRSAVTAVS